MFQQVVICAVLGLGQQQSQHHNLFTFDPLNQPKAFFIKLPVDVTMEDFESSLGKQVIFIWCKL